MFQYKKVFLVRVRVGPGVKRGGGAVGTNRNRGIAMNGDGGVGVRY